MTFFCDGCNKERDFENDYGIFIASDKNSIKRICKICRKPKAFLPDVYFDGKPEENLADDPVTGQPRVFFSKSQKADYLHEHGLREAGDLVHGAPVTFSQRPNPKTDSRHEVRLALKHVKEMGKDVRRQEYLRIIKEGRSHQVLSRH